MIRKLYKLALYLGARKKGLKKLISLASKAIKNSLKDLDTSILNKILKAVFSINNLPCLEFRPKLRYAHSGGKSPLELLYREQPKTATKATPGI